MRKVTWLALLSLLGCATLSPEEEAARRRDREEEGQRMAMQRERFNQCIQGMPILRTEPPYPYQYRVIRVIESQDENEIVQAACIDGADAVISTLTENAETTSTIGGGPYFVAGRTKTKHTTMFVGQLIKYRR